MRSLGLEVLEAVPDPDVVVVCCGGGGLLAGVAAAVKLSGCDTTRIYGVEPEGGEVKLENSRPSAETDHRIIPSICVCVSVCHQPVRCTKASLRRSRCGWIHTASPLALHLLLQVSPPLLACSNWVVKTFPFPKVFTSHRLIKFSHFTPKNFWHFKEMLFSSQSK